MSDPMRVVVIGGGVAGLATAGLLATDGHAVTLVEARGEFGGRAGSWSSGGFRFDTGPSWYLMPEVFDHFYRLMGTTAAEQLDLSTLDPGYRAYFEEGGAAFDLPAGRAGAREAFVALDPTARSRLENYFDSAEDTYRIALDRFLYSSFERSRDLASPELLRKLPKFLRLLLRPLDREIRRRSSDSRIRRLLGYSAVFLGGSPLRVPSMYHLMSHLDVNEGVFYPQGGFARVIESLASLASQAGAELHLDTAARRILVEDGAVAGVLVVGPDGDERRVAADLVVSAADLEHTDSDLLDSAHRDRSDRWWQRREAGPGAVLALLGVRGDLPQLAHHTLLLAEDWDGGFERIARGGAELPEVASLYIGRPSASDADVAPPGHDNLFVLIPVAANPAIGHGGVDGSGDPAIEAFVDRMIDQIARWTNAPDLADRVVVRRTIGPGDFADDLHAWRGSALGPAHTLRQSAFFRAPNRSRRVRGLYFAGSSTIPGVGVPMCLISAELVLKHVRGQRDASRVSEPR